MAIMADTQVKDDHTNQIFVFIHGTASCSLTFFDIMKQLASSDVGVAHSRSKCIAIDLPNFGISGLMDDIIYDDDDDDSLANRKCCERYADIIGHTLQQLGILEKAVIVAHSLGGFLSIYLAHRFPIKKLVLLNPAGILPTLGEYGYYWALFFKAGLPTTLFQHPYLNPRRLLQWYKRSDCDCARKKTEFWLSFFENPSNQGHRILSRFITLKLYYSYWNTPMFLYLMDVYRKVPTLVCFGVNDTICPSHIGVFLNELTRGEIMNHSIRDANHNPCENIEMMVEILEENIPTKENNDIYKTTGSRPRPRPRVTPKCRNGYSYPSLAKTRETLARVYEYLLTHTTYCPPHSASLP